MSRFGLVIGIMAKGEYYATDRRIPSQGRERTFGTKTLNINGAISRRGGQGGSDIKLTQGCLGMTFLPLWTLD